LVLTPSSLHFPSFPPWEIVPLDVVLSFCLALGTSKSKFLLRSDPELDTIGNQGFGAGMLCKPGDRS